MRPLKTLLLPLAALALLGCAGAPVAKCTEMHLEGWFYNCTWVVNDTMVAKGASDAYYGGVLFETTHDLGPQFAATCEDLTAHPDRVPERTRQWLSWPKDDPCSQQQHLEWLNSCLADTTSLLGKTRRHLLVNFMEDASPSTRTARSYAHRRCGSVRVMARFEPIDHSTDESQDDIVRQITPYIGFFIYPKTSSTSPGQTPNPSLPARIGSILIIPKSQC